MVQRPGNADLSTALKGTGVLGSLCRLLAAAADLPGGESLRGAALGIAASSSELHAWMWAVPGVAGALTGACAHEAGAGSGPRERGIAGRGEGAGVMDRRCRRWRCCRSKLGTSHADCTL